MQEPQQSSRVLGLAEGAGQGDSRDLAKERRPSHIGVMCIDVAKSVATPNGHWHSYLAASYIKYLEASGALVIPIWIGREREYYASIMEKVNGVLLPGGAVFLDDAEVAANPELTNYCVQSARHIYELAEERNKANKYFPLWGTCLGFQLMLINSAKNSSVRTECGRMFDVRPLNFTEDYRDSKLFEQLSPDLAEKMGRIPFACHLHRYCITEESLRAHKIHNDWHVLATRDFGENERFITLIEHRTLPFYGTQFHPERVGHEQLTVRPDLWRTAHTHDAIQLARYFAEFFVKACRLNTNRFDSAEQLNRHLIYNWAPHFTGQHKEINWLQVYLFPKDVDYNKSIEG